MSNIPKAEDIKDKLYDAIDAKTWGDTEGFVRGQESAALLCFEIMQDYAKQVADVVWDACYDYEYQEKKYEFRNIKPSYPAPNKDQFIESLFK